MDQQLRYVWLILLWTQCETAPVSHSLVVSVQSPNLVRLGLSATLPCWLNPPQNAEDLEVRWYRDNYDTPVLLYKAKAFDDTLQDASYAGRVSFGLKDATSGGLKTGDVSLKLVNTTIQDAGQYTCYVTSLQGYDSSPVTLEVTETGRSPVLSAVRTEDNMVNVSCESEGWYPQPDLRWSNQHKELKPKSLLFNKDSSGLVSVHSWLLVPSSSKVSCSVVLPNKDTKEATLLLDFPPQPVGTAGWVAFAIVLIAALALAALGVMYYKKKVETFKQNRDECDECKPLLTKEPVEPTAFSLANKNYVNVKLEDTQNQFIKSKGTDKDKGTDKGTILRDFNIPEGLGVTCLTAVKGSPGFTSGQHYWEVSLRMSDRVDAKQSWWLGVTAAREITSDYNFTPNTSNGFWFLSSSPDRADSFQVSTEPKVFFAFTERPSKVGVYLDYDKGEIYFYNVVEKSLIGSLAATFTGEVFPLFNPGKGETSPMVILHREELNQSSNNTGSPEKTSDGTGQNQCSNNAEPPEKTSDGTGQNQSSNNAEPPEKTSDGTEQNQCSENVGCGGETAEAS
ncbi:butyrophilin subfamily 3 member A3-like isoform X2 [Mugil cephalus]|uniref:butyrophilin subfamily 3 member A3-like isoform X2 n=1 Tax=Mugil cephalus TaxID=48193 RepID=UPI001FB6AE14|nr:butyrophilin subfamily 3 member A3-like isoform X2 [Mugil cephalus]